MAHSGLKASIPTEQDETMTSHTPGPWKACGTIYKHMNAEIRSGAKGEGQGLAQVWDGPSGFKDALLMASAPTLLEAAHQALRFLENAPLESGFCCCGDPISGHGPGSGHAPVDDLAYHSDQVAEILRAAIEKASPGSSTSTCGTEPSSGGVNQA